MPSQDAPHPQARRRHAHGHHALPTQQAWRCLSLLFLPLLVITPAHAATDKPESIPLATYRAQLISAAAVVEACRANASACDPARLPPAHLPVLAEGPVPSFQADWQWLRDTLTTAQKQPAPSRLAAMDAAHGQLNELAAETSPAGHPRTPPPDLRQAHAAAIRILAQDEFRAADDRTWLSELAARLQQWLVRLLLGMGRVGTLHPWIAPLLEWLCFGLAAAGLLLFLYRGLRRQTLSLALQRESAPPAHAGLTLAQWLAQADAAEVAGDRRTALHGLYWAAILSLEARHAWRPNPTRTAREYLGLLPPVSPAHTALRQITTLFERCWYGSAPLDAAGLATARAAFAALERSDSRRPTPTPAGTPHPAPAGVA